MNELAIHVDHVSKQFHLGTKFSYMRFSETLLETGRSLARTPLKWMRPQTDESKSHQDLWALRDVSFKVQQGEVVGLIGRNGAGKSTLLKVLSHITRPTKGRVGIAGRVGSLLEVGTGFHPELTGRENIYLNGSVLGMTRSEVRRKFDEIIAFAEVDDFLDTPVKRYSSGMYVRLAFAVAAHLEPEILVVDEVLAVGDARFQQKCLGKMGDVSKSGRTVLFVSHNMTAISGLCSRAIWLDAGQVKTDGPVKDTVAKYLTAALESSLSRHWTIDTAPGTNKIRLDAIRVVPCQQTDLLATDTPFTVEIDFERFVNSGSLNVSAMFYTSDGVCAFNAISPSDDSPPGRYTTRLHIPGNFMNDGVYRLRLALVCDLQPQLNIEDILMFDVQDGPRHIPYHGEWIGVVRPQFDWDTTPNDHS
ncbi:MAG: polysaccharide ABC transporter ATP-binding protein [Planctomycetaceae bacterium]